MPNIYFKQKNEKIFNKNNDNNFLSELFILIRIKVKKRNLSIGYKSLSNKITCDKSEDKTLKLLNIDKIKGAIKIYKIKNNQFKKNKYKISKIKKTKFRKNQVKNNKIGENKITKNKIKESKTKKKLLF